MAQPVQVVIPTYNRPHLMQDRYDELGRAALFVIHESDKASLLEAKNLGANYIIDKQPPSGVNASNAGCKAVKTKLFVLSQDDIKHHPGWLDAALEVQKRTGAMVVGLNDGFNRGEYSVAWLISKPYMDEHGLAVGYPGHAFCPEYIKNYADNELNETAKFRGVWAYAADSNAEHLHPGIGKAPMDETYSAPEAHQAQDIATYNRRKGLFGK